MPQRGTTVDASAFTPLVQAFTGTDPYTKGAMERRRIDLQQERDQARQDIEQKRFELSTQQADRANQLQQQNLQFKQSEDARQQTELGLRQAADQRALQDQDFQDWQRSNPSTPPITPEKPQPPRYEDLGTDPMQSFDTPDEVAKLGDLINQQAKPLVQAPAGQAIPPDFSLPADTVRQIQDRTVQYRQAGLALPEAIQRAQGDLLGAHPTYAPGQPAQTSHWYNPMSWGTPDTPAVPAGVNPDTTTIPPTAAQPVDTSHGWAAQRQQREKDYEQQMADYEKRRAAFEGFRPPVYPGYPWKTRRAANGDTTPPPQPAPGAATSPRSKPQPTPNPAPAAPAPLPKRITTKGGNVLEFD